MIYRAPFSNLNILIINLKSLKLNSISSMGMYNIVDNSIFQMESTYCRPNNFDYNVGKMMQRELKHKAI